MASDTRVQYTKMVIQEKFVHLLLEGSSIPKSSKEFPFQINGWAPTNSQAKIYF